MAFAPSVAVYRFTFCGFTKTVVPEKYSVVDGTAPSIGRNSIPTGYTSSFLVKNSANPVHITPRGFFCASTIKVCVNGSNLFCVVFLSPDEPELSVLNFSVCLKDTVPPCSVSTRLNP